MTLIHSVRLHPAIYLITAIAVTCAFFSGCKQYDQSRVSATAAPTPEPFEDFIIYTSGGQLFGSNLAGDSTQKFPKAGKNIWFPVSSPDHMQIAYWSVLSGFNELWVYDIEQEISRQITFFNEKITSAGLQNFNVHNAPVWMPDKNQIVFSHLGKIWKIDASGFNLETLVPSGTHLSPAISPDGKLLVYISEVNQNRNIFLRQFSTGDEWPLTKFPATHQAGSPAWSPDGKQIVFTVSLLDKVDIWSSQADGSELKPLTRDGYSNSPAWSPDSAKIAFSSGRQDPYNWKIWVMNRDGSSQFSVTRNSGFSPTWIRQSLDYTAAGVFPVATPEPDIPPTRVIAATKPKSEPTLLPTVQIADKPKLTLTVPPQIATPPALEPTPAKIAEVKAGPAKKIVTAEPTKIIALPEAPETKVETPEQVELPGETKPREEKEYAELEEEIEDEDSYEEFEEYADEDEDVLPEDVPESKQADNKIIFTPKIEFYFAKDLIKPISLPLLKQLAKKLNEHPDGTLIVQGFMRGPDFFKKTLPILKTLSRARANSVLRHLIVNEKIRQINVTAIGAGDDFPEPGDTENEFILLIKVQ